MTRKLTISSLAVTLLSIASTANAQTNRTITCTLVEWHGRDVAIVQSWLGEELHISFAQRRIHLRHGERWYMDIPFTLHPSNNGEGRISFKQTGTYEGQRHSIDFSYVLNSNGTVTLLCKRILDSWLIGNCFATISPAKYLAQCTLLHVQCLFTGFQCIVWVRLFFSFAGHCPIRYPPPPATPQNVYKKCNFAAYFCLAAAMVCNICTL